MDINAKNILIILKIFKMIKNILSDRWENLDQIIFKGIGGNI